jgi:carbonic anhydrase
VGVTDTLHVGGDRYQLLQYHFHIPAEHTANGRQADVGARDRKRSESQSGGEHPNDMALI